MSFSELCDALVDGVFAGFGEMAAWDGIADPVRVRVREYDDSDRLSGIALVALARVARVPKADVASPAEDQAFELLDSAGDPTGQRWKVSGVPVLSKNSVWLMPVLPA